MIRIFLFDQGLLKEPLEIDFGKAESDRISGIKNPRRRLESLSALVALNELIKISFGDARPEMLRTKEGKPYFKDCNTSFSLSHSGDISVAAICDEKDSMIGVDIEKITKRSNFLKLSARYFNDLEKAQFEALGSTEKAFFEIWTKKEAYAKMTGVGLSSLLEDKGPCENSAHTTICYEFYNNNDAYFLSLCCRSKNNRVEFYNNSSDIKIRNH